MTALDNVKLIEDYLLNCEDNKKEKAVLAAFNIRYPELDFFGMLENTRRYSMMCRRSRLHKRFKFDVFLFDVRFFVLTVSQSNVILYAR